jgi:hypothetical protein
MMRYRFDDDDPDEESDEDDDFAENDEDDEDSENGDEDDSDVETWQVAPRHPSFMVIPLKASLCLTSRFDLLDWPQFPSSAGTPRPARIPTA